MGFNPVDLAFGNVDALKASNKRLRDENAKLEADFEDLEAYDQTLRDTLRQENELRVKAEVENDKLRKLVLDMFTTISWCDLDCYPSDNKKREYADRMRELGIEV